MKNTKNNILTLRILLSVLILVIVSTTVAFFLIRNYERDNISEALNYLKQKDQNLEMMEQSFQLLYEADNDFWMYTLTYDPRYFDEYSQDINDLLMILDSISIEQPHDSSENSLIAGASESLLRKELIAFDYIRLKRITDSLLQVASAMDSLHTEVAVPVSFNVNRYYPDLKQMGLDTIDLTITTEKEKKGFFKKVKEFFTGSKEKVTQKQKVVVTGDTTGAPEMMDDDISVDQVSQVIAGQTNKYYQQQLRLQKAFHQKMEQQERELILTNKMLMEDLREILNVLDEAVDKRVERIHGDAINTINRSTQIINQTTLVALGLSLILLLLIIITIRQIIKYQKQNIAARKKAEEEAAEKTRFFAFMSHELRTPLTSIVGFTEQLKQTVLTPQQTKYVDSVNSSSEMLLTTVNDILDLSKLDAGKMNFITEPFSPVQVVQQIISSMRPAAERKGLQMYFENKGDEKVMLEGDEMRLKQVLINIVNNAIKYTDSGEINIELSMKPCQEKECLMVKVRDTGRGIPPKRLQDVFSEYSQVHTQNAEKWIIGTGLGLPVCKKIVEQQGGKIWAESSGFKGSTFTFVIPYTRSKEVAEKTKPTPEGIDTSIFKDKKILIVDDTDINLKLLEAIFAKWGVHVDKAKNGKEALQLIGEHPYDLILTDVHMPVMDGIELTKRIRKSPVPEIAEEPVIILTANIIQDEIEKYRNAGMTDYLTKPFLMNDLYRIIRKNLK